MPESSTRAGASRHPGSTDLIWPCKHNGRYGAGNRVDTRIKPAHDDLRLVLIKTQQPIPVSRAALRGYSGQVRP